MPNLDLSGLLTSFLWTLALGWLIANFILFGIPAGWLAGQKGRDPVVWLVSGTILGLGALLAIGLAPRGFGGGFGRCPACYEAISASAEICPHCRTRFGD